MSITYESSYEIFVSKFVAISAIVRDMSLIFAFNAKPECNSFLDALVDSYFSISLKLSPYDFTTSVKALNDNLIISLIFFHSD